MPRSHDDNHREPDYVGVTVLALSLLFGSVFLMSLAGGALAQEPGVSQSNLREQWRIDAPASAESVQLLDRVVEQIPQLLDLPPNTLRIRFSAKDAQALQRDATTLSVQVEPIGRPSLGDLPLRVKAYDAEKRVVLLTIRPQVEQQITAVVAVTPLRRGDRVTREDIMLQTLWTSREYPAACDDPTQVVGQEVKHPVAENGVVQHDDLLPATVIHRGEQLTLRCQAGTLVVQTLVRAMGDGAVGDVIRVRSDRLRQTFAVRVTAAGEVSMLADEAILGG